jgi:undecaprenyl-diphosphatase
MISNEQYLAYQKRLVDQKFFRNFWVFCAIYSVLFIVILAIYFWLEGSRQVVLLALISAVVARLIVSPLIYLFYKKSRPYQSLKFDPIQSLLFSFATKTSNSFPSDHALTMAAVCTIYYYFFPHLAWSLIVVMFLNGLGRIILGYHYVTDIIGGWIIGSLVAFGVIYWVMPIIVK